MSLSQAHDLESKNRTRDVFIEQDCTFSTMLLPNSILEGLEKAGFKRPSPIQLAAIPLARCGFDLIVQAKSGTGKTLVFTIAALESVKFDVRRIQVIIIAPTREIALQIGDVIRTVGSAMKGLKVGVFVGGRPLDQDKMEARSCQVAVGAPGRLRHLIEMEALDPQAVRLLVLDEADRLLGSDLSFQNDINYIFHKCCESKQILALSATYPPELVEFTGRYMRSGRLVTPATGVTPGCGPCVLVGLRQLLSIVPDHPDSVARLRKKEAELFRLLETVSFDQACIFLNYASRAESLNNILLRKGFASVLLTGKKDMETRQNSVSSLKKGLARILVCTDLAARGLDAASVNLVVNTELPRDASTYLHRMGRAGRFGGLGLCISVVCEGMELERFRNLLGDIGGASMFVSIVPKYQKVDLWTEDLENLDRVYGKPAVENDNSSEETESSGDFEGKEVVLSHKENIDVAAVKGFLDLTTNVSNDTPSESFVSFNDLQKELQKFLDERKDQNSRKSEEVEQRSNGEDGSKPLFDNVPRKYLSYSDAVTKKNLTQNINDETEMMKNVSPEKDLDSNSNVPLETFSDNVDNEMDTSLKKRKRAVSELSQSDVDSCMMTASGIDLNSADDNFSTVSIIDGEDSDSGGDFDSDSSPSAAERVSSSSLSSYVETSENEESASPQLYNSIIFHKTSAIDQTFSVEGCSGSVRKRSVNVYSTPKTEVQSVPPSEPQIHFSSQTPIDWCSYISKQIENYVIYCRQFNGRNFEG